MTAAILSCSRGEMVEEKVVKENTALRGGIPLRLEESGWEGVCLSFSAPVCEASPPGCFWATGGWVWDRGLSRSSTGAVEVGRGGNRKGAGDLQAGSGLDSRPLVGPIRNNKARLPLPSCSFLPRAWKIVTRGKTWPELCIRRLVMTRLQN